MKIEQIEPRHLERIERLFHAALERNSNERGAFLADACAGDESLRVAVLSLLSCDTRAADFIEAPALEVAAQLREVASARSNTEAMSLEPVSLASGGPSLAESESLSATPIFIGDYRILRKLGEGGMGVVYEAEQQNPRRRVALKVIRGGRLVDKYLVKLFQREAMALARLKHPGIAAIYESDCAEDGQHYFAMELVRGVPLLDYVKGKRLTHAQAPSGVRQRLELALKVCDAISYAHQRGVIHRDLKPSNILVIDESEDQSMCGSGSGRGEVKVLDFGLARIIDSDAAGASALSGIGQIKGTLPYMSPEQVRGATDEIDVRAD
ncbi:MAG TPA: serine/threonine-protein kinase, partial [Blastocatellia bacterium]|nr:serine/threonine-protein kinase [Blastocatellia bacterium]